MISFENIQNNFQDHKLLLKDFEKEFYDIAHFKIDQKSYYRHKNHTKNNIIINFQYKYHLLQKCQ
jgi:hypothetical protein